MAENEVDPFATSTGLADDIDATFTNFKFGYHPSYVDSDTDEMVLIALCDFKTDDADIGTDGVLEEQIITIGKGWETTDNGKSVVRADGKTKGFNKSTYMGLLIDHCIELDEDVMRGRYEAVKVGPTHAAYWEGFMAHLVQRETAGFNGQKGKTKLLPDRVDGWKGKVTTKGAKKAVAKPAPTSDDTAEDVPKLSKAEEIKARKAAEKVAVRESENTGDPMRDAIVSLAKICTTDEEFITRAYDEVAGLDESEEGMALVDDVESAESIWMTVGGSAVE